MCLKLFLMEKKISVKSPEANLPISEFILRKQYNIFLKGQIN